MKKRRPRQPGHGGPPPARQGGDPRGNAAAGDRRPGPGPAPRRPSPTGRPATRRSAPPGAASPESTWSRRPSEPSASGGEFGLESDGILIGRRPVLEALRGGNVERVMVCDEGGAIAWFGREGGDEARRRGVPVARVPRIALDRLAGGAAHQGIAARVTLASLMGLDELLAAAARPALLLLVDGVEDPRNLGAILRSAAAAGAGGVLLPERRVAPLGPACAKASAGTIRLVRLARVKSPVRGLEALRDAGIWTVGLSAGGESLHDVDLARPTCLVVGGEGSGLTRLVRERCDVVAGLPLAPGVDSLNAAVAAGVALYEALRQRRAR